ISSTLALLLGSSAAYALARLRYQPRIGTIALVVGCVALGAVFVFLGVRLPVAIVVALACFALLAKVLIGRFKRAISNSDIAFWIVSQRILPPVAVVIPIYVLFQNLGLLDTRTARVIDI